MPTPRDAHASYRGTSDACECGGTEVNNVKVVEIGEKVFV